MDAIFSLCLLIANPGCACEINNLAHDDFRTREVASSRLEKMGWRALPQLYLASNFKDLEQRRRAERIIASYLWVDPKPDEGCTGMFPSIYCLAGPPRIFYEGEVHPHCPNYTSNSYNDAVLEPAWFFAFVAHFYYARHLCSEGKCVWNYTADDECMAMSILVRDLRHLGVPKDWISRMLDFAKQRSNPEPRGMRTPPRWLQTWFLGVVTRE